MIEEELCLIVSKITEMDAIRRDGIDFRGLVFKVLRNLES